MLSKITQKILWLGRWLNLLRPGDAYIDGLVQERRNSSALAMELRLSCTNSLIGLGNGLSTAHHQSITKVCGNLLQLWPLETNFNWI